jgi:hypothetical protein
MNVAHYYAPRIRRRARDRRIADQKEAVQEVQAEESLIIQPEWQFFVHGKPATIQINESYQVAGRQLPTMLGECSMPVAVVLQRFGDLSGQLPWLNEEVSSWVRESSMQVYLNPDHPDHIWAMESLHDCLIQHGWTNTVQESFKWRSFKWRLDEPADDYYYCNYKQYIVTVCKSRVCDRWILCVSLCDRRCTRISPTIVDDLVFDTLEDAQQSAEATILADESDRRDARKISTDQADLPESLQEARWASMGRSWTTQIGNCGLWVSPADSLSRAGEEGAKGWRWTLYQGHDHRWTDDARTGIEPTVDQAKEAAVMAYRQMGQDATSRLDLLEAVQLSWRKEDDEWRGFNSRYTAYIRKIDGGYIDHPGMQWKWSLFRARIETLIEQNFARTFDDAKAAVMASINADAWVRSPNHPDIDDLPESTSWNWLGFSDAGFCGHDKRFKFIAYVDQVIGTSHPEFGRWKWSASSHDESMFGEGYCDNSREAKKAVEAFVRDCSKSGGDLDLPESQQPIQALSEVSFRRLMQYTQANGRYKAGGMRRVAGKWIYDPTVAGRIENSRFVLTNPPRIRIDTDGYAIINYSFKSRSDRCTSGLRARGYVKFITGDKRAKYQFGQKVMVGCSCADFKYRQAFVLSKMGASHTPTGAGGEATNTPPVITNPHMLPSLCKHGVAVAAFVTKNVKDFEQQVRDMKRQSKVEPIAPGKSPIVKPDDKVSKPEITPKPSKPKDKNKKPLNVPDVDKKVMDRKAREAAEPPGGEESEATPRDKDRDGQSDSGR